MPHQRLHGGKEARAGGEILPFRRGDFSGGAFHPCRLHVKEIPLHQEMVSVTGSATWDGHSPSVIGEYTDPRRHRDKRHAHRRRMERTAGSGETTGTAPERGCRPALLGDGVRADSPDPPTGAERGPNASETGAYQAELPAGRVIPVRILSCHG